MNTAKERLLKIIDEIPENEIMKILDFAERGNAGTVLTFHKALRRFLSRAFPIN